MRSILVGLILALSLARPSDAQPNANVAQLDGHAALAKQRALQLQRLREYRLAGKFASDDQGRPASVFRDAQGRLCPMAHLIAASGRMDLVDQVVRENNRLQLADVKDGPLWDWMLTSGLTREEIIRIQGIARLGYESEPIIIPREQAETILAARRPVPKPPSAADLHREMIKRAEAVERELAMNTEVGLAIAKSRLPQTTAAVRPR
jgi:hypothetical protein